MDSGIYKLIHFIGIILLLLGLGGALNASREDGTRKLVAIFHGLGAFLVLLGGFGMQAKMKAIYLGAYGSTWPTWLIAKVALWFFLVAALVVLKRRLLPPAAAWLLIAILASAAAYLGLANSLIQKL
jgi:hypothetical protein